MGKFATQSTQSRPDCVNSDKHDANTTNENQNITERTQEEAGQKSDKFVPLGEPSIHRWLILSSLVCVAFLLGISDQLSPILNVMTELLGVPVNTYVLINQLSSNPWFVASFLTAWLIDRYGIKFGIRFVVILTIIQNCVRALLLLPNLPLWNELKMFYYVIMCSLNMLVMVVYFCLPLKVSETWFPENERAFAWVSMMCALELGLTISSYGVPNLVTSVQTTYRYAEINLYAAAILIVTTLLCVQQSKPLYPPSERASKSASRRINYKAGLKIMACNKDFRLHILFMSANIAGKFALMPYLQDILAAYGYDNRFCGTLMALQTGVGILALLVSSPFVPRITNITLGCKFFAITSLLTLLAFVYTLQMRDSHNIIIGATILHQIISSCGSPIYQNMCAHLSSGIIGEASITPFISTGIVVLGGIMTVVSVNLRTSYGTPPVSDYSGSLIFVAAASAIPTLLYVVLFQGNPPDLNKRLTSATAKQQRQNNIHDQDDLARPSDVLGQRHGLVKFVQTNMSINTNNSQLKLNQDSLSKSSLSTSEPSARVEQLSKPTYKVSANRWLILFAVVTVGLTSAICDQASSILDIWLKLLDLNITTLASVSQSISIAGSLFTLPIAWLIDQYGIRFGMFSCTILVLLRNTARGLILMPRLTFWPQLKLFYWVSIEILSTLTSITFWCLPLKISELWFPASERSTAWVISIVTIDIGASVACYMLPIYIVDLDTTYLYAYVNFVCAIVIAIVVPTCVTQSEPQYPPSERALKSSANKIGHFEAIKIMLRNKDYCFHLFFMSMKNAVNCYGRYIEDILRASGYDNRFCGQLLSLSQVVSVFSIMSSSVFVARVKNIAVGCKVFAIMILFAFIALLYTLQLRNCSALILASYMIYQAVISIASPNYQNMTASMGSGILSEATNASFTISGIMVSSNVLGYVFIALRKSLPDGSEVDYTDSLIFLAMMEAISVLIYCTCFHGNNTKLCDIATEGDESELGSSRSTSEPSQRA